MSYEEYKKQHYDNVNKEILDIVEKDVEDDYYNCAECRYKNAVKLREEKYSQKLKDDILSTLTPNECLKYGLYYSKEIKEGVVYAIPAFLYIRQKCIHLQQREREKEKKNLDDDDDKLGFDLFN